MMNIYKVGKLRKKLDSYSFYVGNHSKDLLFTYSLRLINDVVRLSEFAAVNYP